MRVRVSVTIRTKAMTRHTSRPGFRARAMVVLGLHLGLGLGLG